MSGDNELTIQGWSHSVEATWLGGPFDGATAAINPNYPVVTMWPNENAATVIQTRPNVWVIDYHGIHS